MVMTTTMVMIMVMNTATTTIITMGRAGRWITAPVPPAPPFRA